MKNPKNSKIPMVLKKCLLYFVLGLSIKNINMQLQGVFKNHTLDDKSNPSRKNHVLDDPFNFEIRVRHRIRIRKIPKSTKNFFLIKHKKYQHATSGSVKESQTR